MGNLTASEFWNQVGLTESPDSLNREYVKSLQFRSGGKDFLKIFINAELLSLS